MIVVADASPLVALAICDCLEILESLFGEVKVTQIVHNEVTIEGKPGSGKLKNYLQGKIADVELDSFIIEGNSLDRGELSSMALYKKLPADYLLVDEKMGRRIAKLNNIKVIGTLGVLITAHKKKLIRSIKPHIETIPRLMIAMP